jgi:hypothetical protein
MVSSVTQCANQAFYRMPIITSCEDRPKKCREKRCEMNGKMGESGGNAEELRGFYFLKTFNKLAAISTHCETLPNLITNQLLYQLS